MLLETYNHIKKYIHLLDIDYDNGVVKNKKMNKKGLGYLGVWFKGKNVSMHNVIGYIKYGEECVDMQLNHIDGVKTNNKPSNLELVDAKKNMEHAVKHGLVNTGERCHTSILKEEEVKEVMRMLNEGRTCKEVGGVFGITDGAVWRIKVGQTWSHVTGIKYAGAKQKRLSEEEVREIKKLLKEGTMIQEDIAKLFGVTRRAIGKIKTGQNWKHITI